MKIIYPLKDMLHLASIRLHRVLSVSCEWCGCMKRPPYEKTLSTATDVAGEQKVCSNSGLISS